MEMLNFCIPNRIVAVHYCYGGKRSAFDSVLPTIKLLMGSSLRQRLCLHTEINRRNGIARCLHEEYGITHIPESLRDRGDVCCLIPTSLQPFLLRDDGGYVQEDDVELKKTGKAETTVAPQSIFSKVSSTSSSIGKYGGQRKSQCNRAA